MHVRVQVLSGADKVSKDAVTLVREHVCLVVPEFKVPLSRQRVDAAVAADAAVAGGVQHASGELKTARDAAVAGGVEWEWGKGQAETMHLFWALR